MRTPDPARGPKGDAAARPISDEAAATLMMAYAGGDRRAWEPLFDGLAPRLLAFFQRTLEDPASAEQHVEATFIELHRQRRTYRRGMPVRPWLFRIAAGLRVERREGKGRSAESGVWRAADAGKRGEGTRDQEVREALESLSGPERMAIHMHRVERMTLVEIAEVLGWTEEAARCQLLHAYRALRERLWTVSGAGGGS